MVNGHLTRVGSVNGAECRDTTAVGVLSRRKISKLHGAWCGEDAKQTIILPITFTWSMVFSREDSWSVGFFFVFVCSFIGNGVSVVPMGL